MADNKLNHPGDGTTQAVNSVELIEPKPAAPAVNGVKPEFDFSDLSWAESIELGKMKSIIADVVALKDEKEQLRRYDTILARIQDMLRRSVVSIPREWLIKRAPDAIDYSQPGEVARWLRKDRVGELIQALQGGAGGEDDPNA